jgi:hypothetical protein
MNARVSAVERCLAASVSGEFEPLRAWMDPTVHWYAPDLDDCHGEAAVLDTMRHRLVEDEADDVDMECIDAGQSVVVVVRRRDAARTVERVTSITFAADRIVQLQDYRSPQDALPAPVFA